MCEAHANHNSAPRNTQAREENARSDFASEHRSRRLENDVCDEEHKGDNRLRAARLCQHVAPDCILPKISKNAQLTYLISIPNFNSTLMPAIAALDKFVRSISETQYMTPTTTTKRLSRRWMIFFCSSGVK